MILAASSDAIHEPVRWTLTASRYSSKCPSSYAEPNTTGPETPALLYKTSMRPNSFSICSNISPTYFGSETSPCTKRVWFVRPRCRRRSSMSAFVSRRGGPPAGDHHVPAAPRRLEGKVSPHPRAAAGDHDHLACEGGVRIADVPVGVGPGRHAPDHVAGAGGIPLRLQRREKAEQRICRRMPRVRFRHLLTCRIRERLEETVRLEGPLDGGRELPLDRELLVREGGVSQEAAREERWNPLVEGPLGHPGKKP